MDELRELLKIDVVWWVFCGYIIGLSLLAFFELIAKLSSYFGKPVKWIKKRNTDHELVINTAQQLKALEEKHAQDIERTVDINQVLQDNLNAFMNEMRETMKETQNQMSEFTNNRIRDREQSFAIQKELTDGIKVVADGGKRREEQIEAVMIGNRELLGAEIDRRFNRYIEMKGIPSDELDEFVSLHDAYKGCKGNHNRDAKYQYIIENLPVLPVESKLKNMN